MDSSPKISSIDTCILLRIIQRNNTKQFEQAKDLLLSGQDFYVDDVVIMEVIYVLTKDGMPRDQIIENLLLLLGNPSLIWDKLFFTPIFEEFVTHPSLSFNDCLLDAKVSMKRRTPLWTFDKKFAHQTTAARLLA